jgi:hypothetical protein
MSTLNMTREHLEDYLIEYYEEANLEGPQVSFWQWTIGELVEECVEFGLFDGNCCEEGPDTVIVEGITVIEDYELIG